MAEDNSRRKWNPQAGPYLGEVSSLAFLNLPEHVSSIPYLLAGSGSEILLYDLSSGELIRSFQVFEGVRVHGTVCSSSFVRSADRYTYKLVVFGEKRVKIFSLIVELASSTGEISVNLEIFYTLPRLSNWVFDVCFLQDSNGSLEEEDKLLAIGSSDNSVGFTVLGFNGFEDPSLRIASGTIFNEIIVWRAAGLEGDNVDHGDYCASHMLRLTGHEGSIFRIVWSLDGSKLVSVSDDRSARIWEIDSQEVVGPVLFGHSVVWDCCISDSLIVTAGEDCTCRVWGVDGTQLEVIKEHIGRGIWRCLYDPNSSLLVTAGFDSAIKVHQLHNCGSEILLDTVGVLDSQNKVEFFSACLPNSRQHTGLIKSEYVRCLQFTQEHTMYVATNHGCLYHARLSSSGNVTWTELVHIPEEGPIITMDVMPGGNVHEPCALDDWTLLLSKAPEHTEEEEEVPEELATYECCFETEDSNANNHDSVFVFNLDTSLARDEIKTALRKHFESCGVEVTRVFVPIECRTGVPLGFAFVDVDDNLKAIKGHSRFMGSCLMFITNALRSQL
ncbi:Nucleolin 2 [Cardamine amara subsp. amara]|uniref:Nucleolin 2 n=1 Tax=Cardamine amara subsp. amara TaxID=228776 RepID=A0ABD1AHX1_CARAN